MLLSLVCCLLKLKIRVFGTQLQLVHASREVHMPAVCTACVRLPRYRTAFSVCQSCNSDSMVPE
jgi:hypothetical protein